MPKFQVVHQSHLDPEKVFEKLNIFMNQKDEMAKFDSSASWSSNPSQLTGSLKGKQFSAQVLVSPEAQGSKVTFEIEIGFLLTPLKGKIAEILQSKLNKHLV